MLRQAFRLRQRSILQQITRSTQNISPLRISQTRTFQRTTRPLYDDSDTTLSPYSSPSLNDKVNHLHSEMAVTKSELTTTKSELAHLTENTNNIQSKVEATKSELAHLTENTNNIQSKVEATKSVVKSDIALLTGKIDNVQSLLTGKIDNVLSVVKSEIGHLKSEMTTHIDSKFDKFYFRMFWAGFTVLMLGVGGFCLRFQTPAIQTSGVQTPAIQTPAVQAPAVQAPAVQTPAAQTPAVG